jgi:L-fucono-1,5-lactonase
LKADSTRRDFLRAASYGAGGLALMAVEGVENAQAEAAPDASRAWIIDTHTHFYDPTRPQGVPWPGKDDPFLYRPVMPQEYEAMARPLGVAGTVVVEASPWVEDNQWILDLAERERFIVGLVGNLLPGSEEFRTQLRRFGKNRLFRGIRIGAGALKAGLEQPRFLADLKALSDRDLELDVNGGPEMLPSVARLAGEVRGLRIVVNHVANVRIDGKTPPAGWLEGIRLAGERPNVYCKVSALVEGTGKREGDAPADVEFYRAVLDAVWEAFGEDRLIYGSNWPVSARFAPYARVQRIVSDYFQAKGNRAAERYFRRNSEAVYKWVKR